MALKEGRSKIRWDFFKDDEMDFQFARTLAVMSEKGAEIGECFKVKRTVKKGGMKPLSEAWAKLASFIETEGKYQEKTGNLSSAHDSFLRASNYYRSAMTCLSPLDTEHYSNWKSAKECFEKAGSLSNKPFEYIKIPFENGFLPCYFLQPNFDKVERPTVIVVTGGEGTAMEMYFWCAGEGLRRNYNIFLCELPGNPSTLYNNPSLTLRADIEVPMKNVLDYLESSKLVDNEKIAIIGYSAGGYFASRTAAFDKRIKALIPNSPLRDIHGMFTAVFPKFLLNRHSFAIIEPLVQRFANESIKSTIELVLWESGINNFFDLVDLTKQASLVDLERNISCPTFALCGEGEGKAFLKQANSFINNISSKTKKLRVFTLEEGAGAHCQIDNLTLAQNAIYDWLDSIFECA